MESPILTPMPQAPLTLDQIARTRIKAWIQTTGITQAELAARIGRNQAWMSRYLAAEFDADLETLNKMAISFGHSLGALLTAPVDPMEAQIIERFRALPAEARDVFAQMLDLWTRPQRGRRSRP